MATNGEKNIESSADREYNFLSFQIQAFLAYNVANHQNGSERSVIRQRGRNLLAWLIDVVTT